MRGYVCECCHPLAGSGRALICKACGLRYVRSKNGISRAAVEATTKLKVKSGEPRPKAKARSVSPKPKSKADR